MSKLMVMGAINLFPEAVLGLNECALCSRVDRANSSRELTQSQVNEGMGNEGKRRTWPAGPDL